MTALTRSFRRRYLRRSRETAPAGAASTEPGATPEAAPVEIAPGDPLLAHFQAATGVLDVEALELDSPALRSSRRRV